MKNTSTFLKSLGIVQPTVVISETQVKRNIEAIAAKAKKSGTRFRPHFKTHQCAEIGEWFRPHGVNAIAVSSLDMARYFADHGWRDITVAIVANTLEMDKINALAGEIRLHLLVDSPGTLAALDAALEQRVQVWIKVDIGAYRTGIRWDREKAVVALARQIQQAAKMDFAGILTHSGQSYRERSAGGIRGVYADTVAKMAALKAALLRQGMARCDISIGDTPTSSIVDDFSAVDELRPGTFVFYDLMQLDIGACRAQEIAVAVACPVIGLYPERGQIVVYGGAVHLSKDSWPGTNGKPIYGALASLNQDWLDTLYLDAPVISISQEHGIIQAPPALIEQIDIGDLVAIVPVHCCLTCNLYPSYTTLAGQVLPRRKLR